VSASWRRPPLPLLLLMLALPGRPALAGTAPAEEEEGEQEPADRPDPKGGDAAGEEALSPQVEALISAKEREVRAARAEGIKLLEDFLRGSPATPETAEALFKLAELTWEEAQADYLDRMGQYQELVAACKKDRSRCPDLPRKQPTLDLSRSQSTYLRLIREYPRFRKLDTVLYLYAFSLRDQGRTQEAIAAFERLLAEYPRSRFRADAWMALAEHRFYERQDFGAAQRAYGRVLKYPRSPLYGLALFKTAWCAWKLGQTDEAARRFKQVLDLGQKAKDRSAEEQKRAAELSDQALDYLVELFTEDDSKTAEDAYGFLSQIGGKDYSQRVLRRFADTVYDQARYERSAQAYLFLISLDRDHPEAPMFQKRVVESYQALGRADRANAEMRRLAIDYGPKSAWAKANSNRPQLVGEARAAAEGFILAQAKGLHGRAQRTEKESRVVDKELYGQAAEAYAFFLDQFPDSAGAAEVRYLRGDVLYFKLGDNRAAGLEYLAVGKSRPVGPNHKDALLNAMSAFEKLRQPAAAGAGRRKREVTDDDRRFAEAADLYATLFPKDKDIVTVIYKNGQFFYDHGDYDEAVKRFGLIIEQHPDSPTAAAAGDRLLECLGEAKDYANIEHWSRRLKKTRAFAARADQERLDGLIAGALLKQGEAHAARNDYAKAAEMFRRVAQEYPAHPSAAQALNNAGAAAERAGRPAEAVAAYRALADRYPKASAAPAALLVAARIEESIAAYGRAAALYEQLARRYPQSPDVALALRQAGLLRQTLGQYDRAASHFGEYEQKFKGRPETRQVAFQKGLVLVERKDWKGAAAAFGDYARSYEHDTTVVEALVRKAEAHMRLGDDGAAREALARALAQHRSLRKADTGEHAAQARYLQGELIFREYERVKIAGRPRQLRRALEEKAKLLEDARKVYLDVLGFRAPEWATASLLRIGQAYEGFARGMRKAEVPRDLNAEEKRLYREELEKAVIVIEDKALDAYRSGYAKALEIGVYNRHTRALRQALGELDQGEYPRDVELRPSLRPGELRVALDPIEEIRRD
jgi:TolA-binding protein